MRQNITQLAMNVLFLISFIYLCNSTQKPINLRPPSVDQVNNQRQQKCAMRNCRGNQINKNGQFGDQVTNQDRNTKNLDDQGQIEIEQEDIIPVLTLQVQRDSLSSTSQGASKTDNKQTISRPHFNFFFYYGILGASLFLIVMGISKFKKWILHSKKKAEKQQKVFYIDSTTKKQVSVNNLNWNDQFVILSDNFQQPSSHIGRQKQCINPCLGLSTINNNPTQFSNQNSISNRNPIGKHMLTKKEAQIFEEDSIKRVSEFGNFKPKFQYTNSSLTN